MTDGWQPTINGKNGIDVADTQAILDRCRMPYAKNGLEKINKDISFALELFISSARKEAEIHFKKSDVCDELNNLKNTNSLLLKATTSLSENATDRLVDAEGKISVKRAAVSPSIQKLLREIKELSFKLDLFFDEGELEIPKIKKAQPKKDMFDNDYKDLLISQLYKMFLKITGQKPTRNPDEVAHFDNGLFSSFVREVISLIDLMHPDNDTISGIVRGWSPDRKIQETIKKYKDINPEQLVA